MAAIKEHHKQTALEFKQWLILNPQISRRKKTMMFNSFADANFYNSLRKKKKPVKAKKEKFIKRT